MTPDYGFASGREAEKASRKWQFSFNAQLKTHNLVFYYLELESDLKNMDLLASETARLVLSYTLDQHLPATSKQLVSRLLMTLSSIDKTFNFSLLRCPSAGTLPSWPTCPQLSCEEPPGLAAGASKMYSESFRSTWATSYFPLYFIPDNQDIVDAITEIAETIPGEGEELRWSFISE